ncbi:MAG: hypothetical protein UX28_C0003G0146 [Candidatus Pacebacteria bacterium GW2011_GWA1_46_10]|nr:MAG: hypothetical protein UX28_C0003G0146 [Candidatus Pacebacteria bacterium GW2011_GWA1_46_10]HCR81591.1 hypothetical protein [Candidatus Paceibacterota bacterium]
MNEEVAIEDMSPYDWARIKEAENREKVTASINTLKEVISLLDDGQQALNPEDLEALLVEANKVVAGLKANPEQSSERPADQPTVENQEEQPPPTVKPAAGEAPKPTVDDVSSQETRSVRVENEPVATTVLEYVKGKVSTLASRTLRMLGEMGWITEGVMQRANEGQSIEEITKYWMDVTMTSWERHEEDWLYHWGDIYKGPEDTGIDTPPEAVINQVSEAVKAAKEKGELKIFEGRILGSEQFANVVVNLGDGSIVRVDGSFSPTGEVVLKSIYASIPKEEALKAVGPVIQAFIEEKKRSQQEKAAT